MSKFRDKTLAGIGWTTGAQIVNQIVRFAVSVVLARLLTPEDFGLLAMTLAFTGFATLVSEQGFGAALIQHKRIEEKHYSSIFWVNLTSGLFLTTLVMVVAPFIARFYNEPALIYVTRVVGLNFLITPLYVVQRSILGRKMNFRSLAQVHVAAIIVGGGVATVLALAGYGVWSLVWQTLVTSTVTVATLWWISNWRPHLIFHSSAISELLSFSLNLTGFRVFNYWIRNADNLLIGKFFEAGMLGLYTRAYGIMRLPVSQISAVLSSVMFPALSRIQDDKRRSKQLYLSSISMIALVSFPMMMGLLAITDRFVVAVYGPQWAASAGVVKIFCLLGMVQSLQNTAGWIFAAQGRTDWMFLWGIGAGMLLVGSLVLGVWWGSIEAVATCYAFTGGCLLLYPSLAIPGRLIEMTPAEVVGRVAGTLGCSVLMAGVVWTIGLTLPGDWPEWSYLAVQIPSGVVIYVGLIHSFKLQAYRAARHLASELWFRVQGSR